MGVMTRQDISTPTSGARHQANIKHAVSTPSLGLGSKHRRVSDCYVRTFSEDIPSDLTLEAGGMTFCLHKFPLVTRSGRIRKLVAEQAAAAAMKNGTTDKEAALTRGCRVSLPDMPGGAEAFELAAKFCYAAGGFELGLGNVAMARCAAEYLQMTEEFGGPGNLVRRAEAFLTEVLDSCQLGDAVRVLQSCEGLLPMAEDLRIVSRCIDAAASHACKEQVASSLSSDFSTSSNSSNDSLGSKSTPVMVATPRATKKGQAAQDHVSTMTWAEELCGLRVDFFQRVLAAMRARGLRYDCLGGAIVMYAQRSLRGLMSKRQLAVDPRASGKLQHHYAHADSALEHEQRILIETVVSLLPPERNTASVAFLFGLLRAAIQLDTTIACRLDLERRIGLQLPQATLDDLLIPSLSYQGDTLFDVDTVRRIAVNFLQQAEGQLAADEDPLYSMSDYYYSVPGSPGQSSLMKVARLLDSYLAEIAPDANLSASKFIAIAELMPDHARVVDDGLYRAIDIYLKAHPGTSDAERKKICARMDCRKLTQEACSHAAQNERLPVQVIVQVLYFEQIRLKSAMGPPSSGMSLEEPAAISSKRMGGGTGASLAASPNTNYAAVCRENRELKLEMARMRMQLGRASLSQQQRPHPLQLQLDAKDDDDDMAHDHVAIGHPASSSSITTTTTTIAAAIATTTTATGPGTTTNTTTTKTSNKFLSSVSKTLHKLNPFTRASKDASSLSNSKSNQVQSRRRRHSIS